MRGCGDCPAGSIHPGAGDAWRVCGLDEDEREVTGAGAPPEWCPLRAGDTLLRLAEPGVNAPIAPEAPQSRVVRFHGRQAQHAIDRPATHDRGGTTVCGRMYGEIDTALDGIATCAGCIAAGARQRAAEETTT